MKWDYKLYEWVDLLGENSSEIKNDVKYKIWLSWGLSDAKVIANMWTSRSPSIFDEDDDRHEWVEFKYPLEFKDEDFDLEDFDLEDFHEENYTSQYHEPHNCGLVSRFQKGSAWYEKLKSGMSKNPPNLPYPPYPVVPYSTQLVVSQCGFNFRWEYELAEKYAEAVHVNIGWDEHDEHDDGYDKKVDIYNKKYDLSVNQFYIELEKNDGCCHVCDEPFEILHFHPNREIHVDHDHNRKDPHYRGLLCVGCNTRTMSRKTMEHYESGAVHRYMNSYYERCGYEQENLVFIGISPEEASARAFGLMDKKPIIFLK